MVFGLSDSLKGQEGETAVDVSSGSRSVSRETESTMTVSKSPRTRVEVSPLEDFLHSPPAGFSVERVGGAALLVRSDADSSLVLIDDIETCGERVIFQKSLGR